MNGDLPRVPSPVDAFREALAHTRAQLFPFRFDRWLALGLVAFLDQCGRQGGTLRFPNPGGSGGPSSGAPDIGGAREWLGQHIVLVIAIAAAVLLFVALATVIATWLRSRGTFMYIDNVATGRSDVARPWREHASLASSFFAWHALLALGLLVLIVALCVPIAFSAFRLFEGVSVIAVVGIVVPLLVIVGVALLSGLFTLVARDFVAPLQYVSNRGFAEALATFADLLKRHPGAFFVYAVLKIVYGVAIAAVVLLACCVTCCCAALPVVQQAALQPVFYLDRAWSLFLLRQMGFDPFAKRPGGFGATIERTNWSSTR